jgi:4-hydroxymandelate oxidase
MGMIEDRWRFSMSRRDALASLAAMLAGSPLLHGQLDPHGDLRNHKRIPGFDEMITAFDFEPVCYANITLDHAEYMQHGEGSEWNMRRNREAFDWVRILAGNAVDPRSVDLSSTLLGVKLSHPVLVAPSSQQGQLHPDGEMGMYRGATAANTIMAIANGTSIPHPKIAAAASGVRWNQFYPAPNLDASRETMAMFHDLGTRAVIITVDQQASVYERDLHIRNLGGAPRTSGQARGGGGGAAGAGRGGGPARAPATSRTTPPLPATPGHLL